MLIIICAIKFYFFSRVDNYSLRLELHISYFFFLFYRKMIKIVCTILAIITKDLEMYLNNLNLSIKKSTIWFKSLTQKKETKTLYCKY